MLVFDGPKYAYTLERQDGTMQGENAASFLYVANDLQFVAEATLQSKVVQIACVADDLKLVGPFSEVCRVLRWIIANCEDRTGNVVEPKKTKALIPEGCENLKEQLLEFIPLEAQDKQISVGAGPCLGSVVGWSVKGKHDFVMQKTVDLCERVDQLQHEVISGQATSIMIRSCINSSLLFLARTVPPAIMRPAAEFLYKRADCAQGC